MVDTLMLFLLAVALVAALGQAVAVAQATLFLEIIFFPLVHTR
jgi:hypothetical protein